VRCYWLDEFEGAPPGGPRVNVSGFLAAHGMVGVTINYRLAPPVSYPAEHQDIAAMVAWLRAHAAEYGGDGAKISPDLSSTAGRPATASIRS